MTAANPFVVPGARVRCVDHHNCPVMVINGREYVVQEVSNCAGFVMVDGWWLSASRFKPVVRSKAPCVASLDLLIERAKRYLDNLTPEQREAHFKAQRESWVRGEIALSQEGLG